MYKRQTPHCVCLPNLRQTAPASAVVSYNKVFFLRHLAKTRVSGFHSSVRHQSSTMFIIWELLGSTQMLQSCHGFKDTPLKRRNTTNLILGFVLVKSIPMPIAIIFWVYDVTKVNLSHLDCLIMLHSLHYRIVITSST